MRTSFRDDAFASFRLVRTEWWIGTDLVAGVAGYVIWVAGSAALGGQLASLVDVPLTADGALTDPALAAISVFWLVLPALVGAVRVRSRLLNLRGNVSKEYRLDRPAALLVPPGLVLVALLLATFLVAAFLPASIPVSLLVGLVPATLYLLVRTMAYSYRVYAFSRPLLVALSIFATLVVQAAISLLYLALATGYGETASATVATLSLPADPLATAEFGGFAAPTGLAVAVLLPIGLVLAYLVVQSLAALAVRGREPTVRPSRVRTGQRYPPWLEVAANGSAGTGDAVTGATEPAASRGDGSRGDGETSRGGEASQPGGQTQPAGGTATGDAGPAGAADGTRSVPRSDGPASGGSENDPAAGASVDDTGESSTSGDAESVSHTRVFTPPGSAGADPPSADSNGADATCPDCGAAIGADAEACPGCGADVP